MHNLNHIMSLQWMVYNLFILEVANDFYYALDQLYNNQSGCFHKNNLNIPANSSLFIVG